MKTPPPPSLRQDQREPSFDSRAAWFFAILKKIGPLAMIAMFGLAIWLLSTTLADNRFLDIRDYITNLPWGQIVAAIAFTAAS